MGPDEDLFQELRRVVRETRSAEEPEPSGGVEAIPGFELLEELHRGGQGVVYRAVQLATHREVALKVLLRGRHASTRDRMRFEREIDLASRLRHPDIVTIYDSGSAEGRSWFAMEYVHGRRLDLYLHQTGLPQRAALELFARIVRAVAAAHRRGVIHRDLKPSNVLVDEEGNPHVLDFGIAKAEDDPSRSRVTATGEFMGTLAYASPEQVMGDPGDIDTRTDVYSLGVVLYQLVTGRLPYDVSGTMARVVENITRAEPADPRELVPLDEDLHTIVATALAKDVDERYASADALARDVEHWLAGEPIEARGRSTWYVLRKGIRRHRVPIAVATLFLVSMGVAGAVWFGEHLRAERQSENALLVRELLQDVLGAAAPQRMGADVTLLEVYEEAAGRIESALEDAPDAQAAFHLTLGDTYRSLLLWPEAEDHLAKALERYRAVRASKAETARCLDLYGRVLAHTDPPRALPVLEEALELRRGASPGRRLDVAESERSLAIGLASQYDDQDYARAEELLRAALATQEEALGATDPEVATTRYWLGRLFFSTGRPEEGQALLSASLAGFEAQGEADPRMVDTLRALAASLRDLGRYDEARAHLDRAVALTTELFGDERDVEMLRSYASLHAGMREYATAERLLRRAVVKELDRWARKRPNDSARIADVQVRLEAAEPPASEPPYAEAFAVLREYRGNGAFELASWSNDIVRVLMPQGRLRPSEPLLEEALRIHCRAFGMDCPVRMEALQLLAEALESLGRSDEAVPLLEEILETSERLGRQGDPKAVRARALLERCTGDVEEGVG